MSKGWAWALMTLAFLVIGTVATWLSLALPLSKGYAPMFGGIIAGTIAALLGIYATLETPKEDRRRTFNHYSRYGTQDDRLIAILMALVIGSIAAVACQFFWHLITP